MILIVATDDPQLKTIAEKSIKNSSAVYGKAYQVFEDKIPNLQKNEDLFVIAHGAYLGDNGNPVIGSQKDDFFMNGIDLWQNIQSLLPKTYAGTIYVDACEAADHDHDTFSFIEVLQSQVSIKTKSQVYGRNGKVVGLIPLPTDKGWVAADKVVQHVQILDAADSGDDDKNLIPITQPQQNPFNLQATKYYVFNETGNIMMATTEEDTSKIDKSVRDVFSEVAVFFAAMTKAISTTINPETKKPYSIYNYAALSKVISGSGLFIHVTEEDVSYKSESFGANFSKQLIEALVGLATGTGEMAFASAMVNSMGKAGVSINQSSKSSNSKVANIIFICEYIMGMPIVSAMVVYADTKEVTQAFNIGPCFKESSTSTTISMHKDTYMFVTPDFIKEYATDLLSIETDAEYNRFVNYLRGLLDGQPQVMGVNTTGTDPQPAPDTMTSGTSYAIIGENFGSTQGTGTVTMTGAKVVVDAWTDTEITFTPTGTITSAQVISVKFAGGETEASPGSYKLKAS